MKKPKAVAAEDLRAEYRREDLGPLTRGKYAGRVKIDPRVVILRPEVARAFPTSEAVNDALMRLIDLARAAARPAKRTTGRAKPR
jgi:hypothetical protein